MLENTTLISLHKRHIKGTLKQAIVAEVHIFLCNLTNAVTKGLNLNEQKVYLTSRMLKHLYDKRPASEYDYILDHLTQLVKYPDHIFCNKDSKRGDYLLLKSFAGSKYVCSLELIAIPTELTPGFYVATCFNLKKESYLNGYNLVWSWKDDTPSS